MSRSVTSPDATRLRSSPAGAKVARTALPCCFDHASLAAVNADLTAPALSTVTSAPCAARVVARNARASAPLMLSPSVSADKFPDVEKSRHEPSEPRHLRRY